MVSRMLTLLVVVGCGIAVAAGCASDPPTSKPDVESRVAQTDALLGFPLLPGLDDQVTTDVEAWVSGNPFPLYLDPQKAIGDLRRDGFLAGIIKIFKATQGVGSAGNVVVQVRDAKGAANELERQAAFARALPCPEQVKCTKNSERFDVEGVPGDAGIDVKQTFAHAETHEGATFRVTHDLTIVFTKGAFVYQLFVGGPGMDKKRVELIAAARAQYERVP